MEERHPLMAISACGLLVALSAVELAAPGTLMSTGVWLLFAILEGASAIS